MLLMSCRPQRLVVDIWISEMFVSLEKSKKSRPFPQLVYIPIWAFDNNLQYIFSDIPNNDKDYNSFLHLEIENIIDINIHLSYCHSNSNHLWFCDDFLLIWLFSYLWPKSLFFIPKKVWVLIKLKVLSETLPQSTNTCSFPYDVFYFLPLPSFDSSRLFLMWSLRWSAVEWRWVLLTLRAVQSATVLSVLVIVKQHCCLTICIELVEIQITILTLRAV